MKWISTLTMAAAVLFMSHTSHAGLFQNQGSDKTCDCGEGCPPNSCRPVISRPCQTTIYSYQRKYSNTKPPCCDIGPHFLAGSCRASKQPHRCVSIACGPCGEDDTTMCPSINPAATCAATCCVPSAGCNRGCGCDRSECCEIATLIYEAMTACYATQRRNAIHRLGDNYDCVCHPEIMNAFIYALNDSDERVRSKAADEIGDQVRRNRCICGSPVIQALRQSLADCDRGVRRQAEQSLKLCGYDIIDGHCHSNHCAGAGKCWSTGSGGTQVDNRTSASEPSPLKPQSDKPADSGVAPASATTTQPAGATSGKAENLPAPPPGHQQPTAPPQATPKKASGAEKSKTEAAPANDIDAVPAPSAPKEPNATLRSRLNKKSDATGGALVHVFTSPF